MNELIYESPDNGKTIYARKIGETNRTLVSRKLSFDSIKVPISVGELVDKLTILKIKSERISDLQKLDNIMQEYKMLSSLSEYGQIETDVNEEFIELYTVNLKIWNLEDSVRECERTGTFDSRFVDVAREIYKTNDRRAQIKKKINLKYESGIIEEKSYKEY